MSETIPALASERVIINSPMSFAGAAQRSYRIGGDLTGAARVAVAALLCTPIVILWWAAVLVWYLVAVGLFGIVTIPYRLLRRGARKRKAEALQHRELLEAVKVRQIVE